VDCLPADADQNGDIVDPGRGSASRYSLALAHSASSMLGGRPNRAPARCAAAIESALAARLHPFGIRTTADLVAMALASARDVGTVVIERLVRELNGVKCDSFKPEPEAGKATTVTRPVWRAGDGPRRASRGDGAARGREDLSPRLVATWLIVFAHGRYRPNPPSASRQTRMSPPSDNPRIIACLAAKMMEAMYQPGGVYTKCGVLLKELLPQGAGQGDVFAVQDPRARVAGRYGWAQRSVRAWDRWDRSAEVRRARSIRSGVRRARHGRHAWRRSRSPARSEQSNKKEGGARAPPYASVEHLGDNW